MDKKPTLIHFGKSHGKVIYVRTFTEPYSHTLYVIVLNSEVIDVMITSNN